MFAALVTKRQRVDVGEKVFVPEIDTSDFKRCRRHTLQLSND